MRTRIAFAALCAFLCATALAETKMVVLLIGSAQKDAGWGKAGSRKVLRAQVESGELVNDETTDLLVRKRLFLKDAERGLILDGYPANAAQAEQAE